MNPPSPWTGSTTTQPTSCSARSDFDSAERVVRRDAAVGVRAGRAVDLGRERAEAALVVLFVRHRHREQRPAVEGVLEDDDAGLLCRRARDLDRVLDGLGAGVQEQALLVAAPARRELAQAAADVDVRLVQPDHEALVEVAVDLLVDRGHRGREPVARVLAAEPAGEVDVDLAVDVLDLGPFGTGDDDRRRGDPARHVSLARGDHALRGRALLDRHRVDSRTKSSANLRDPASIAS